MGLEKLTVAQIIGILHISGGVMLRDIDTLEAIVVVGDLGIILYREAHVEEDILKLPLHEGYRVI